MSQKVTQAQVLVALARQDATSFRGNDGRGYLRIEFPDGHVETHRVRSKSSRRWLRFQFYKLQQKPPSAQALQDALGMLEAIAEFSGHQEDVFLRLGERDDCVFLDLANSKWEAAEISRRGWTVTSDHGLNFRRSHGMRALDWPDDNGSVEELSKFGNFEDEDTFVLFVSSILGSLNPRGPYVCLNLVGEQGSAKTTTARVFKAAIDPSSSPVRTAPRDERDLMIAANNEWILPFDNLSRIPNWLSDAYCRLATGGGFSTRQLYTDDEEIIFDATRPVIINGIEDLASRQDLVDRSIILALPPIRESSRRTESAFWGEFRRTQPRILGGLLNAASTALRNRDRVRLESLPRMADFAIWITAAEEVLPWAQGTFLDAYRRNRKEAIDISLESDYVASAIRGLVTRSGAFEGTATELLGQLELEVSEKVRHSRAWPRSARAVAGRMRRAATFLRHDGIAVEFLRQSGTGKRLIVIKTEPDTDRHIGHNRHKAVDNLRSGDDSDGRDAQTRTQSGTSVLFEDDDEEVAV